MGKVKTEIVESVAFIAAQTVDGKYLFKGSVFFLGWEKHPEFSDKVISLYWVTARHVIDGIRGLGCTEVHIRLNDKEGGSKWVATKLDDWFYDKDDALCDIAVLRRNMPAWADHTALGPQFFFTSEIQEKFKFDVTDDVIVTGLFRHRAGARRNVPIVRMGSIASWSDDELVSTKLGEMQAYLIETRSIGGLSGSPVFVLADNTHGFRLKLKQGDQSAFLMGVIHGHYDVDAGDIDAFDAETSLSVENVNTGIAIVTPFHRLFDLLEMYHASNPIPADQKTMFYSAITDTQYSLGSFPVGNHNLKID